MGIWIELGVFVLALAFGWWQIRDVKKAREATQRQRQAEREARERAMQAQQQPPDPPQGS